MFYQLSSTGFTDSQKFVARYAQAYYTSESSTSKGPDSAQLLIHKLVKRTPKRTEEAIDRLVDRSQTKALSQDDVVFFLMWKLGCLDKWKHCFRTEDSCIRVDGSVQLKGRSGPIDAWEIASKTVALRDEWGKAKDPASCIEYPERVFRSFQCTRGLGSTYICALLYLITKAEWPIYDFFSARALAAISGNYKPGDRVEVKPIPDKSSVKSVVKFIEDFKTQIDKAFSAKNRNGQKTGYEAYIDNRDIDRALWVYGHLFI